MEEDRYYQTEEGQIIDASTGEIIETKDIGKAVSKNFLNAFYKMNGDMQRLGLENKFRLIRAKNGELHQCIKVKEKYIFNKTFRVEVRNMFEISKLSIHARAFIATFEPYLYFPTNSIVVNGKRPTIEEMWEMLGVKKTKMYEILKELENADVIRRVDLNGYPVIYFNPFLYSCGGLVDKETFEIFENSIYNPVPETLEDL